MKDIDILINDSAKKNMKEFVLSRFRVTHKGLYKTFYDIIESQAKENEALKNSCDMFERRNTELEQELKEFNGPEIATSTESKKQNNEEMD